MADGIPPDRPSGGPLTLYEAAEQLGVHYMTVYRYVRTGRLPGRKVGAEWRIEPRDLAAFVSRPSTPERPGSGPGPMTGRIGPGVGVGSHGSTPEPPSRSAGGSADGSSSDSVSGSTGAPATDRVGRMAPSRRRVDYSRRLVGRLVAGDERGSWTIVQSALSAGLDPDDVYLEVLAPALTTIGERWAEGEVSVGQEHQASVVVLRLIGRLGPLFTRRGRTRGTVVLGAPAGDHHSLPSALFADLLRGLGIGVVDLGADTPTASFVDAAGRGERLLAVAVSVTTPDNDASVVDTVTQLREVIDVPVLVGGGAVRSEEHAAALGSDEYAPDVHVALALFARLADQAGRARRRRPRSAADGSSDEGRAS